MGKPLVNIDPYEIPSDLIPSGIIYQWVAKKEPSGRIDPQYQRMIEAGWGEVPYARMRKHYRGRYQGEGTEVLIGGQVLMERAKEMSVVARDKEIDQAFIQASQGRTTPVDLFPNIRLSAEELASAAALKLSSPEYIKRKITMIAGGADNSLLKGREGALMFVQPVNRRVAKYRWLNWLFDLISKEV